MHDYDDCINCLICVNVCPFSKNDLIVDVHLPKFLLNYQRFMSEDPKPYQFICYACNLCYIACPRNIKIPKAVIDLRKKYLKKLKKNSV